MDLSTKLYIAWATSFVVCYIIYVMGWNMFRTTKASWATHKCGWKLEDFCIFALMSLSPIAIVESLAVLTADAFAYWSFRSKKMATN